VVRVSAVDEAAVATRLRAQGRTDPADLCLVLAEAKARDVAEQLPPGSTVVIGADSVLDLDGIALGKPADAADARDRWRAMAGQVGQLRTGHFAFDLGSGRSAGAVVSTTVRFGRPDEVELAAYVASGEPLRVAGAFTLDGRSAPFIDGIDGDPSNVIGLSLPTLRRLLADLGICWTTLWT
jgi:septum formation protein